MSSSNYLAVRPAWLSLGREEVLEPGLPIVDAHHHFYDRPGWTYLADEFLEDVQTGHNVRATVYMQAQTGAERNALLPDVPSAKEAGIPAMDIDYWVGLGAPAGTPQPVIDKLSKAINAALAQPEARKKFAEMGLTVVGSTPEQATQFVDSEIQRWSAVIKQAGIKPE